MLIRISIEPVTSLATRVCAAVEPKGMQPVDPTDPDCSELRIRLAGDQAAVVLRFPNAQVGPCLGRFGRDTTAVLDSCVHASLGRNGVVAAMPL